MTDATRDRLSACVHYGSDTLRPAPPFTRTPAGIGSFVYAIGDTLNRIA